jgi:hypothetical protein
MGNKQRNETEVLSRNHGLKYRAAVDATNTFIEYEGWALDTAAADSDTKFQICKHTYDANNFQTATDWASGNDKFDKSWDLRTTYF